MLEKGDKLKVTKSKEDKGNDVLISEINGAQNEGNGKILYRADIISIPKE